MDKENIHEVSRAKIYSSIKLRLSLLGMFLEAALLIVWAFSPLSRELVNYIEFCYFNPYIQFFLFFAVLGSSFYMLGLIMDLYGGYFIEHAFGLSTQTIGKWVFEHIKSLLISVLISVPLGFLFFFLVRTGGEYTYLIFATVLFFFSVILARVAPVILFPLFYTFTLLPEGDVRTRLTDLLAREKILFSGIFSFNMSKNTRKANAALSGIGKSRRIILSDTLLESFTPDEIESVFAHEIGHFKHKHILIQVLANGVLMYLSFFLCGLLYARTIAAMGFLHESDIAALPILVLYLSAFGLIVMPFSNMLSRWCERQADAYALDSTGNPEAFISAMERLASMNLSEKQPHPLAEFFLHGHPSIAKRIAYARARTTVSSGEAGE